MNVRELVSVLAVMSLAAACGDDQMQPADAPGPCWPLTSKPGGQLQIGTGDVTWEAMPDVLPIVRAGSQSDPFMMIHARMRGMPPGDPNDFFDPANPRTMATVVIDAAGLTLGLDCPASMGYVPSPEAGAYDLLHSLRIGFGLNPADQVDGMQARITIEVVGSNGLYASDEKTVTLMAPPPQI